MFGKVRIKKSQLDRFRKLAREQAPLEIQAYLVGDVVSPDLVSVDRFAYTRDYEKQTSGEVQWGTEAINELRKQVIKEGKTIVGDIHSHPNHWPIMSSVDYRGALIDSLMVCGICSVYKSNKKMLSKMLFWTPTSSLPCEVIYK
jgi:proteasome lid subunit RPN8/RPN11